jgi:hypothetical protein
MPGNRRRNSTTADNSPRCSNAVRIAAASVSVTANIPEAWGPAPWRASVLCPADGAAITDAGFGPLSGPERRPNHSSAQLLVSRATELATCQTSFVRGMREDFATVERAVATIQRPELWVVHSDLDTETLGEGVQLVRPVPVVLRIADFLRRRAVMIWRRVRPEGSESSRLSLIR